MPLENTEASGEQSALAQRVLQLEAQVAGLAELVSTLSTKLQSVAFDLATLDIQTLVTRQIKPPGASDASGAPPVVDTRSSAPSDEIAPADDEAPSVPLLDVHSTTSFLYTQLDKDRPLVRILALKKSAREDDPIECRLVSINLDDIQEGHSPRKPEHEFTPLSYTWGEPAQTKRIYIDGAHLPVTAQLHRAMTCLRKLQSNLIKKDFFSESSNSSETFWWIDAICVNQQDLDERSHQVSLMTRLYRSAELVHVWLGDEDDTTTKAMRLVHHVAYRPTSYEDILSWKYIRKPGQTHRPAGPGMPDVRLPDKWEASSNEEKRENFQALLSLFNRPWFSRVWVRQEIALPSAVMINCGSQQCTWEELMRTASTLSFFSDDLAVESAQAGKALAHSPTISCFQNAMALDEVRAATARGQKYIAFTDLACHTRDCLATDARDKVYAMLPMTNPDEIPTKADYRIDKFEAYVAVLLPLFSSNLNFLAACQNEEMPLDRPSWIPDFNQPWIAHPIWPFLSPQRSLRKHDFRAGVPIIEHFATSRSLAVHGVVLDEIDRIDTAYVQHNNADHSTLRNLIDTWWTFSHDRRRELLDETDLTGVDWRSILFINSCYDEDVFKKSLCLNPQWDTSARGPEARESRYTPMKDRALKDDPTFQRVRDTLLGIEDDSGVTELMVNEDVSLSEPKGLGHFRRMAIGRRAAMTTQGLTCLIPEYAQLGDSVAWFKGSTETYVLRPQGESGWSIVGSTYLMCQVNQDTVKDDLTAGMLKLV